MDILFKPADPKLIPEYAYIIASAFNQSGREVGIEPEDDLASLIYSLENSIDFNDSIFSAWYEGRLVGCFCLTWRDDGVYEITKFSVSPDYQHIGIGQKMLEFAVEQIQGIGGIAILCTVFEANREIKHWLNSNQFEEVVVGDMTGLPCTICILRKDLTDESRSITNSERQ